LLFFKENYKLLLVCFYSFRRIHVKEIKKLPGRVTPLMSSTPATTVHLRRRTTWIDNAGSGHAHSFHEFNQLVQSTIDCQNVRSYEQMTSICSESRVFLLTLE